MASIDRRETRSGQVRYRVRVRRRGVVETASFGNLAAAESWAQEVESAIDAGRWSQGIKGGGFPLGWVLDRYLAAQRPGTDVRQQLGWWRRQLGREAAGEISRRRLLALRRQLGSETTTAGRQRRPATVNRYMAALSGLFSWALKRQYIDQHPLKGVEPLLEGRSQLRFLSDGERDALIEACREVGGTRLEALVVLALSTGARRGELLGLHWSDVDLAGRKIVFHGRGRSRGRALPLSEAAGRLLRNLARVRRIDCNLVFAADGGPVRFPRVAWNTALARAEVSDFRFRDLRHSAAAYLAKCGATLPEIAAILGARTLQGVRRYSALTSDRPPAAIRRMQDELFET